MKILKPRSLALTALLLCASGSLGFAQESSATPEIAPGVHLPATGSIFVTEKIGTETTIKTVHATEILSNTHAGSNFARSMVYAGPHQTVELDKTTSGIQLQENAPVLYVRLPPMTRTSPETGSALFISAAVKRRVSVWSSRQTSLAARGSALSKRSPSGKRT